MANGTFSIYPLDDDLAMARLVSTGLPVTAIRKLGTALGLLGSLAAGRWLAGAVWRVAAFDPVAFGVVALLLMAVGLQACYWPARRAARIDPLIAIRETQ